jgi:HEAT repeat protein
MCRAKGNCAQVERPEGWSGECMGSQKVPCFWKRHAASWGITCLACLRDKECPACDEVAHLPDAAALERLEKQARLEGDSAKRRVLVGTSAHFYVATDILSLKLLTQEGGPRVADQHEVVHLFLERAEKAYDDFVDAVGGFGDDVRLGQPMAIYLAQRKNKKEAWQAAYFGSASTDMLYGGNDGRVAGMCWNGFALSADEAPTDRDLHASVRHMIGHILFSCWHGVSPFQKNCPKWAFAGVADWLCKSDPLFVDWTVFCSDEGPGPNGTGKDWDTKARAIAGGRHDPIEKLFGVASLSHLTFDDLVRSWSYMDLMLREDRERWLATLREIRDGTEPAIAFQKGLGMSPEEFDKRWADRLAGRRKTMGDVARDASGRDAVTVAKKSLSRVKTEQDPQLLAALLRGFERVPDVEVAEVVLSRLPVESDLVRETIVLLLDKTEAPEVVAWLREKGLTDPAPMVRAYVARAIGDLKDAAARPALETMLDDPHWLARANAARSLAILAAPESVPALVAKAEDANEKAWISKADALATFGDVAHGATAVVAAHLGAPDWQTRLTACRALAKMGDAGAMDALIERLETEGGRLRKEILAALRAVSHENFADNPQTWRTWWKGQKPKGIPPPDPQAPHNPEDDRYAKPKTPPTPDEPTYYGRRIFSQSVLFVIDVSLSMDTFIKIPPDAAAKLGQLQNGPRIDVAKAAVSNAIRKLDPRARFNVVFFSTNVRPWQPTLVPANDANKNAALDAIRAASLEDETNVYGALKAAVGLHEKPTLTATLDPIPDTIYFMTDGTPTRGEIVETEPLLSWMRDVNRFAKVELHVIAMGNLGVDLAFLERLATENGGEFVHVPDT